jgi:hypothetical protein
VVVALWLPVRQRRQQERQRLAGLAAELVSATGAVLAAFESISVRSRNWRIKWPLLVQSLGRLLRHGRRVTPDDMADAVAPLVQWQQQDGDFALTMFNTAYARFTTACAQISFAGDDRLRQGALRVSDAVSGVSALLNDSEQRRKAAVGDVRTALREFQSRDGHGHGPREASVVAPLDTTTCRRRVSGWRDRGVSVRCDHQTDRLSSGSRCMSWSTCQCRPASSVKRNR